MMSGPSKNPALQISTMRPSMITLVSSTFGCTQVLKVRDSISEAHLSLLFSLASRRLRFDGRLNAPRKLSMVSRHL